MSITSPLGFRASGVTAGLKASGRSDVALVLNDGPLAVAAGVFTSNRVVAAPVVWSRVAQGTTGVHGDDRLVFGADAEGRFQAWQRASGEPAWSIDRLKYRGLSAPVALGRVVAVGDSSGLVHLISREDGSEMTRLSTDGSPVLAAPVLAGDALVVQTRNGGVYAWRPQ